MDHETSSPLKTRTLVAQGLGLAEPVTRALVSPIHMSTTYLRDADNGYSGGRIFGAAHKPPGQQTQNPIAPPAGAAHAFFFGSGRAAPDPRFPASLTPPPPLPSPLIVLSLPPLLP